LWGFFRFSKGENKLCKIWEVVPKIELRAKSMNCSGKSCTIKINKNKNKNKKVNCGKKKLKE